MKRWIKRVKGIYLIDKEMGRFPIGVPMDSEGNRETREGMKERSSSATEFGIVPDLIERKKAEEEIVAWKNRYEIVIAASGQLTYEYDVSTGDIIWGSRLEQVLGYSPGEMQGGITQWESLIHPEDRDKVLRMMKIVEKYSTPFDAQYRFRHKDGSYRWLHDRGNLTTVGIEKSMRLIGLIQDITPLKQAGKELQESEARYQSLFKKNQAAMLMIDPQTTAI